MKKRRGTAQDPGRQQVGLRVKGPALEFGVLAFAHDPLHILLRQFQIAQQDPFKLAAPIGALRYLPHLLQRQSQVALEDLLAKGLRSAEKTVRELLDIAHTQPMAAGGQYKLFNLADLDPVHAHELAQRIHVRINREGAGEELLAHWGAHLAKKPQAHAHPGFAPGQFGGDLGDVEPAHVL